MGNGQHEQNVDHLKFWIQIVCACLLDWSWQNVCL